MSLITTIELSKSFGPKDIFTGISLSVSQRARVGLVGANGVGKTTLLRIMAGLEDASAGEVQKARSVRLGYLPQQTQSEGLDFSANDIPYEQRTLWQECLSAFADLIARQKELERLDAEISRPDSPALLLETYGRRQHEFEELDGYTYEARIRQTLDGLGFEQEDYERPLEQLSGGQRTRALLARLLLSQPDLLLLDEPTNSLDISAIEWLESYLRDWEGAVVCISHDRYFLDQVVTSIWEMTPALEVYRGNYSAYLTQRAERYERRLEEYQTQQAFIEKEEEFIRRNIAGQNTRQAQGRRKRLERLLVEAQLNPPRQSRRLSLRLQAAQRSGDLVVRTYGLSVGYADEGRPLFHVPDLVLERGECAAIIGPNGAGKTTFLKTLLAQIPPYAGEVELGASLHIGYFAQAHEGLHADYTLTQEIENAAPGLRPQEVRDYLARFLFTGDDVYKMVSVLSGGERGRLALACLALSKANLLLLDEPTNHLDLPAQEALQNILADYAGTILLVSHDRYLVDALATQIWEAQPADSRLNLFKGSYSEYRADQNARAMPQNTPTDDGKRDQRRDQLLQKKADAAQAREARRRQERAHALEMQIAELETQLELIGRCLENPPADLAQVQRLGQDYNQLQQKLDSCMEEWGGL